MSIYYNGTNIPTSGDIYYNGTCLNAVYANNVLVWNKSQDVILCTQKNGTSCHFYTDSFNFPYVIADSCNTCPSNTSMANGLVDGNYRGWTIIYNNKLCSGFDMFDELWPQNNDKYFYWGLDRQPLPLFTNVSLATCVTCVHVCGYVDYYYTEMDADGYYDDYSVACSCFNYTWTGSRIFLAGPEQVGQQTPTGYPYCGGYTWTPSMVQGAGFVIPLCNRLFTSNNQWSCWYNKRDNTAMVCNCDSSVCAYWGLSWTVGSERRYCWLWCNRGGNTSWNRNCVITLC